jgi:hypothetical protein
VRGGGVGGGGGGGERERRERESTHSDLEKFRIVKSRVGRWGAVETHKGGGGALNYQVPSSISLTISAHEGQGDYR